MKSIKSVRIKFHQFKHDTGKAILVSINNQDFWFPYFAIKNLIINKKLGGHFIVKTSFLEKKGISYDNFLVAEYFEHHIPQKLDPSKITHDESLIKKSS